MDPLAPFVLPAERLPDFSESDWQKEIDQHWERQCFTDQLLAGEIPIDTLLDCLNDQGIDPDWYCEFAANQVERAIRADVITQMDSNEVLVYVRRK